MKKLGSQAARFLITIFLIATVLFFMLRLLPGGPFDDENALPEELKVQVENRYHLHDPLLTQYRAYMEHLVHGDLGESYRFPGMKVSEILKNTLPTTFALGFMTLITSYFFGILGGVISARAHHKFLAQLIVTFSQAGSSLPTFIAGPILIILFSFTFDLFPPALWDGPSYWVLPVLALSLRPLSLIIRLVRGSAIETMQSEFIKSARAKGLTESKVLFKHVLKNSLVPLLSVSGSLWAQILSGSFIVEQIFAVPGVAKHFVESVGNRDYSLLIGLTLVYSGVLVLGNIIFDWVSSFIDPRIGATEEGR